MAQETKKAQNKNIKKKNVKEENKKVEKVSERNKSDKKKDTKEEKVVEKKQPKEEKVIEKKIIKEKKKNDKLEATLNKIDENRKGIILFVVGFLLSTLLFRCILWPDRIATLKDGTQPIANINGEAITADQLYSSMKEYYSVKILLNDIDKMILNEKYPEDDEMKESVQSTADYYYSMYEQYYGYTKEQFLSEYGFSSENDFLSSLTLDNQRNKYYEDYALSLITEKEINKYYEDEVFGDVDSKHILVSIDEENGLSDEEAKKLAEEIIAKLNNGTSWDDVISEYEDSIIHEELGYRAFNASLESAYLKECRDLKVGTYSKTPVLTSYGYHIVYKNDQKDKPELSDVEAEIKEVLAEDLKDNDDNLYYKALINMRKEANLEFFDTKLKDEYEQYISNYK